ncbi:MAG: plasmid stabilization protein [Rhizobium sp.]|nr:plasmid stabilization protein [Rhizobium sp.]
MGDLLIRDVPDSLKRDLSEAARKAGRSLSDEAKLRLTQDVNAQEAPKMSGADFVAGIQALFADIPYEEREEFAKIMDEVEARRKTDFGRPFSFEE